MEKVSQSQCKMYRFDSNEWNYSNLIPYFIFNS